MTNDELSLDHHQRMAKESAARVAVLELALQGIASCATQCVCCEMHRRIAVKALGYEVGITTDSV